MQKGSKQPIQVLEELEHFWDLTKHDELGASSLEHWLLRFPSQCVLTAEAILWTRQMTRGLNKPDSEVQLKNLGYDMSGYIL